jgi:hypothetical protein
MPVYVQAWQGKVAVVRQYGAGIVDKSGNQRVFRGQGANTARPLRHVKRKESG